MIIENLLKNKNELKNWIEKHADDEIKYITLERQIFAFYLLEKLVETGVKFVFKGGTSLILLLEHTKRFSTDIDILITPIQLEKLVNLFETFANPQEIFTRFKEDNRKDSEFPKKHYKFYFSSLYKNEDQDGYILLDAVFCEDALYEKLVFKPIKNDILPTEEPYKIVFMPSITDIMIDKLTAFAPRTIGVKFYREQENGEKKDHTREVAKQWFDINEIFKKCDDFTNLKSRYIRFSKFEIEQRKLKNIKSEDCLEDTFECALEYLKGGVNNKELNTNLKKGIRKLTSFVNVSIESNYFIECSVNVIELISRVFCEDIIEYDKYIEKSKSELSFESFIKEKGMKSALQKVVINNGDDRERFVKSLRVISNFLKF